MNEKEEDLFLELKNIQITIGNRILIKEAHFSLKRGEWALLLGSNGSGKTTLLKVIAGRWKSWRGTIVINNKEYNHSDWNSFTAYQNGIVLLDQLPELPSHLRVWEYLSWGLPEGLNSFYLNSSSIKILLKDKIKNDFFSSLSLESFLKDLKENEKFKVSILSAILRAKSFILWDESTIFFNSLEKESLFYLIESLQEIGISHLMVTHEKLIWGKKNFKKFILEYQTLSLREGFSEVLHKSSLVFSSKEPSQDVIFRASLEKFSFSVGKGEIVAIVGEGEDLLRKLESVIMGKESSKKGSFFILGSENITSLNFYRRRKKIGYVKAWLGVREEPAFYSLLFPLILKGRNLFIRENELIFQAKERVIPSFYRRLLTPWKFLSGGEKQSLILEREINNKPSFLLVPFPFQGLDQNSIKNFSEKLRKFSLSGAVLILTTEAQEVLSIADRVILVKDL